MAAVVAVQRAITSPVSPRNVFTCVDAVVIVVSWSVTSGWSSGGSRPARLDICSIACAGVLTAPYTDSAVTRRGAMDSTAKNAMPALATCSRSPRTCRPARRRIAPQARNGMRCGDTASVGGPVGAGVTGADTRVPAAFAMAPVHAPEGPLASGHFSRARLRGSGGVTGG